MRGKSVLEKGEPPKGGSAAGSMSSALTDCSVPAGVVKRTSRPRISQAPRGGWRSDASVGP